MSDKDLIKKILYIPLIIVVTITVVLITTIKLLKLDFQDFIYIKLKPYSIYIAAAYIISIFAFIISQNIK